MTFKNRKAKVEFLKGIANGTRSIRELVRPITGMWILGNDTCIYTGLCGTKEISRKQYDRQQIKENIKTKSSCTEN